MGVSQSHSPGGGGRAGRCGPGSVEDPGVAERKRWARCGRPPGRPWGMSHVHSPDLIGNAREQWVNPTGGLLASVESPHPFRSCYSGTYLNKRKDVTHPEIRRRGGHTLHSHQR